MNPFTNSILGIIFLLIGAVAVLLMLHLKGNAKDRIHGQTLVRGHRILGYLFIAIYLFMVVIMIVRISSYQEELPPRVILHLVFALGLLPLLAVKILIARKYSLFTSQLFSIGFTIFILGFLLNAISAGHYFLYRGDIRLVAISSFDKEIMDENIGRQLVVNKCAKCHSLERVFNSFKDEEGWTKTVNRMALIDAPNIRDYDAKQIIYFLLKQQENRKGADLAIIEEEMGKTLIDQKCSLCHNLEWVYKSVKSSKEEWLITIERMKKMAGDPDFLSAKETEEIMKYLTSKLKSPN